MAHPPSRLNQLVQQAHLHANQVNADVRTLRTGMERIANNAHALISSPALHLDEDKFSCSNLENIATRISNNVGHAFEKIRTIGEAILKLEEGRENPAMMKKTLDKEIQEVRKELTDMINEFPKFLPSDVHDMLNLQQKINNAQEDMLGIVNELDKFQASVDEACMEALFEPPPLRG